MCVMRETCCASDADRRLACSASEANREPVAWSASLSNRMVGICGGPLWRTPMPYLAACAAIPSRKRWPMARMCSGPSLRLQHIDRRKRRRHRGSAAPERARRIELRRRLAEPLVAGDRRKRIAVGDRLAPCAQVGLDAEIVPASMQRQAKSRPHVVQDEGRVLVVCHRASARGKRQCRAFPDRAHSRDETPKRECPRDRRRPVLRQLRGSRRRCT